MAVLITPLANVTALSSAAGTSCIVEVSGQICKVSNTIFLDYIQQQLQDPEHSTIAVTINNIEQDISSIETKVEEIINRIDNGDINNSEIKEDISNIQNSVTSITNNVSSLQSKINQMESKLNTATSNISKLQSDLSSTNSTVGGINTRLSDLEKYKQMLMIIANEA